MLTALEQGVKGGRWYTLMDKVAALPTLRAAFARVKANRGAAGVDHVTVAMYERRLDRHLAALSKALQTGTYRPQPIRRHWIPKPGTREYRPLGIPTVRDRIVQTAIRLVLEPIFEVGFADHSYGFRPQRGAKDALRRVVTLLRAGYTHVVDADLQTYFDSIPHAPLRARVQSKVSDGRVLALLDAFLQQPIFEALRQWTPEQGTPQGAVISPLLANLYLDPLDHVLAAAGYEMVRYADDFVVLCRTAEDAEQALVIVRRWTEAAGLRLHPPENPPGGSAAPRRLRLPRLSLRTRPSLAAREEPEEAQGRPPPQNAADQRPEPRRHHCRRQPNAPRLVRDFKHSHGTFKTVDSWLRMRLRSVLRKRAGRHGRGIGLDQQRWPNRFFAAQGLYSLALAHAAERQSAQR